MRGVPPSQIICLFLIGILCLSGCKSQSFEWSYKTAIFNTNNEYFQPEILVDDGATFVLRNKVTGELFYGVAGAYGITLTSIGQNQIPERGR